MSDGMRRCFVFSLLVVVRRIKKLEDVIVTIAATSY